MSFVVVARYLARPGERDGLLPLLDEMARESRKEPGNLAYRAHVGTEDDRLVVLYEEYVSEDAFTAHCETEHFQRIVLGQIVPRLESREVYRLSPRGEA
ncbi:antibiotic biosynthesis monooxygenase [Actinomadura logoneensis]|uniref:Antibiotic biosynthesis monooxygenase n=1 Tax=Actinomadura logoneensis TaxID=2293572 RepID=A0A372JB81_9ACTN|nr:putative quinol monooxygenase [Actinomadura logoneensis]RFU37169.1 antibiotic biosynthesis monooxygenase [Actinomadura logoneensis]